jgi:Secreted and surface protein containing fasciclin-like repeats
MSLGKKLTWFVIPAILIGFLGTGPRADEIKKEEKAVNKAIEKDIVDTAMADAKFTTLVTALKTAKLVETLKGPGPFTVFAPTDDAFKKLPPGTLEALLKDPPKLEKVLLYHVVPGKKMAKEVMVIKSAKTAQGTDITIKVSDGGVMADNAKVVTTDIPTSNGVIHVIDTVLMPKM